MSTILMTSNTSPYDVFEDAIASRIKDTGDCWLWEGATAKNGSPVCYTNKPGVGKRSHVVSSMAYRLVNEVQGKSIRTVPACEEPRCVHPEHLAFVSSVVGTMLKIKRASVMTGDCWVWTGELSGDAQTPRVHQMDGKKMQWLSVRKFVYTVERGLPYELNGDMIVKPSCGEHLCVSFKHLERVGKQADERVCPEGHELGTKDATCRKCKYAYEYALMSCSRGHKNGDDSKRGYTGCTQCDRDDARQYMLDTAADFLARWS